jgi:dCMP deaminase
MLDIFARRATCARRQVACILTTRTGQVLSCGYNGVPRGMDHCTDKPCAGANDAHGDNRNCLAVHAEQNALMQCRDLYLVDTAYCSCTPCFECAKLLANLPNVRRVVVAEGYADHRGLEVLLAQHILIEEVEVDEEENAPSEPIRTPDYYGKS